MLTPKQITIIRRLHWIDNWPLRRIERHLQISRKTIGKYLLSSSRRPVRSVRASKLDPYKPIVAELLQQDSSLKPRLILQHLRSVGYRGGITILRDYVRGVRTKPSGPPITGSRQEVFDWMRAVLQGEVPQSEIATELGHVAELDKLLIAVTEERLSVRNRAMAVLAGARGIGQSCARGRWGMRCWRTERPPVGERFSRRPRSATFAARIAG
jgi:hypothetical protein